MEIYREKRNEDYDGIYANTGNDRGFVLAIIKNDLSLKRIDEIIQMIRKKDEIKHYGIFEK